VLTGLILCSTIDITGQRTWLNGVELKDVTRLWGLHLKILILILMLIMMMRLLIRLNIVDVVEAATLCMETLVCMIQTKVGKRYQTSIRNTST
jgi:hypothetical protein